VNKPRAEISKFLSFVLRHKPEAIGLLLDAEGWQTLMRSLLAPTNPARH
jgi:putative RNA 2'-phosphotransferase